MTGAALMFPKLFNQAGSLQNNLHSGVENGHTHTHTQSGPNNNIVYISKIGRAHV